MGELAVIAGRILAEKKWPSKAQHTAKSCVVCFTSLYTTIRLGCQPANRQRKRLTVWTTQVNEHYRKHGKQDPKRTTFNFTLLVRVLMIATVKRKLQNFDAGRHRGARARTRSNHFMHCGNPTRQVSLAAHRPAATKLISDTNSNGVAAIYSVGQFLATFFEHSS